MWGSLCSGTNTTERIGSSNGPGPWPPMDWPEQQQVHSATNAKTMTFDRCHVFFCPDLVTSIKKPCSLHQCPWAIRCFKGEERSWWWDADVGGNVMFKGNGHTAFASGVGHGYVSSICICLHAWNEEIDVFCPIGSCTSCDSGGTGHMCIWVKFWVNQKFTEPQQHQKVTHARVKTAMLKAFVRYRWHQRALRCSIVTGSLLAWWEEWGANLAAPCLMCKKKNKR